MTIRSSLFLVVALAAPAALASCGGGQKPAETVPPDHEGGGESSSGADPGAGMVMPDVMDDIQRRFDRKRTSVSRCLSAAVDAKELPKNSRGKITLNVVIEPGGKAGEVKIAKATIESQRLSDCVIAKVKEIVFPEVPQSFPTSYTYAFEAM